MDYQKFMVPKKAETIMVRMDTLTLAKLHDIAKSWDVSQSEVVRILIKSYGVVEKKVRR